MSRMTMTRDVMSCISYLTLTVTAPDQYIWWCRVQLLMIFNGD